MHIGPRAPGAATRLPRIENHASRRALRIMAACVLGSSLATAAFAAVPAAPAAPSAKPDGRPGADSDAALVRALAALRHASSVAEQVDVFEGLPHPFEKQALEAEKKKRTRTFDGEWFYAAAQPMSMDARDELHSLLGNSMFKPYGGMKLCGGFHADYAIRWSWSRGANSTLLLLCFGCAEARVIAQGSMQADLTPQGWEKFKRLLAAFHQERPERAKPAQTP